MKYDREPIMLSFSEDFVLEETSKEILPLLLENETGAISNLTLTKIMPSDITWATITSSMYRLNKHLRRSGSPLSVAFTKPNFHGLGFGLISSDTQQNWDKITLGRRVARQSSKDILNYTFSEGREEQWHPVNGYNFAFPEIETGMFPTPTVVLVAFGEPAPENSKVVYTAPSRRDVLRVIANNNGYIDEIIFSNILGRRGDALTKCIAPTNKDMKRFIPRHTPSIQPIRSQGYCLDGEAARRNEYVRSLIDNNSQLGLIIREAETCISRHLNDNDKYRISVAICRLDEALDIIGYSTSPIQLSSNLPYLLVIRRADVINGYDFENTAILEATEFTHELISSLNSSIYLRFPNDEARTRKIRIGFRKMIDTFIDAGYENEAGTGIITRGKTVFPIPKLG